MWDGGFPFVWWVADEAWWDDGIPLGMGGFLPPALSTPSDLIFNAIIDREDPQTQIIEITNVGGTDFSLDDITISESASWLVTWVGGTGDSQRIMNRVDIEGLEVGVYTTTVTITCSNASNSPQTYTVTLTVDIHADPTSPTASIIIWVATWGNDDSGTGSQTNPYKTIERALQDFVNGSQIRILDGTYTPTYTIVVSGLEGSIFAENPEGVTIKPQRVTEYDAAIAITNSNRFTVQGVNIIQSDTAGHIYGIYANDVENFIAYTCSVSDFDCPSGCIGINVIGKGRVENCLIEDLSVATGDLYGIYADGPDVIDCTVRRLINRGSNVATGIEVIKR
jgi:hypothetical protein